MKHKLGCLSNGILVFLVLFLYQYSGIQKSRVIDKDKEITFILTVLKIGIPDIMLVSRQMIAMRNELEKENNFLEKIILPPAIRELNPEEIILYENQVQFRINRNRLCCFSEGIGGYGSVMLANGLWYIDYEFVSDEKSRQMRPQKRGWIIDCNGACGMAFELSGDKDVAIPEHLKNIKDKIPSKK